MDRALLQRTLVTILLLLTLSLAEFGMKQAHAYSYRTSQVAEVVKSMGLKLNDRAAERAFEAKDFRKVSVADFHALQNRAEVAKREEKKLQAERAPPHAIFCNKIIKVGTEAVIGAIKRDKAFELEHLQKFNKNVAFAGKTCKDVHL